MGYSSVISDLVLGCLAVSALDSFSPSVLRCTAGFVSFFLMLSLHALVSPCTCLSMHSSLHALVSSAVFFKTSRLLFSKSSSNVCDLLVSLVGLDTVNISNGCA